MAETLVIAFRGALHQAPENTLPAIEKALASGADLIALDVQGTRDREPVLLADARLDRTTGGTGRVQRLTLKEVQALDAGSWFGAKFKGTRVPRLAEAVQAVGPKARLLLHLPPLEADSKLAEQIRQALQARAGKGDFLVFADSMRLKAFRETAPGFEYILALGEKVDGWLHLEKARTLGLKFVRPHRRQVSAKLMLDAHARELKVLAHFADEEDEMRELLNWKVDGIVTGRPERLQRVLKDARA